MLELADVHTYYGNIRALRGVSLSVAPGEIEAGDDHRTLRLEAPRDSRA